MMHKRYELDRGAFGAIIYNRRTDMGFTQNYVAYMSGCSISSYCLYERGVQVPRVEVFLRICQVLEIPIDKIYPLMRIRKEEV